MSSAFLLDVGWTVLGPFLGLRLVVGLKTDPNASCRGQLSWVKSKQILKLLKFLFRETRSVSKLIDSGTRQRRHERLISDTHGFKIFADCPTGSVSIPGMIGVEQLKNTDRNLKKV